MKVPPGGHIPARLPPKGFVKLTSAEMEQKRSDGLCFNYDERYTVGHHCALGHLMLLVGKWEDANKPEEKESQP
ncbi:unnamed protein product [Linum trigynum]|uniref:Uncharacterized protein n=1 Tax=Linum trigynum TaxID=586398 RepID=A0AAV2DUH7_9ROSI